MMMIELVNLPIDSTYAYANVVLSQRLICNAILTDFLLTLVTNSLS